MTSLAQVKLTEEDIKKFYDRNKESLKEPLKIQVEYLTYPFEQFSADAQVSDKEIEEYYQNNQKSKFHRPREAKIRYIALAIAPTASAEEKKAVLAKAEAIVKEARRGKDFAQLAKKGFRRSHRRQRRRCRLGGPRPIAAGGR